MRNQFLLFSLLAVAAAFGCENAVTLDSTKDDFSGADAAPDSNSTGGDSGLNEGGPGMDGTAPDLGSCATYTPGFDAVDGGGHVGGGPVGCTVAVDVIDDNGSPRLVTRQGTVGSATFAADVLTLSCSSGADVLMSATIRCYKGPGEYEVPAGALVLGDHVSDRKCSLDVDRTDGVVRGFISCPTTPASATNVFANTTAPIGLGVYALPEK